MIRLFTCPAFYKHLFILLVTFAPGYLPAQVVPAVAWDKSYNGDLGFSNLSAVKQTADGGYILGGHSAANFGNDKSENSRGQEDFWIIKLDAAGNKTWDKTFGGAAQEKLAALQQTADGGYIAGGYSFSGISGDKSEGSRGSADYWVVKMDANGIKQWDKRYGSSGWDNLTDIRQTADGGYILGGFSGAGQNSDKSQPSKGFDDFWVVKLDAGGNKVWDKGYGGSASDVLTSLLQTADGGYLFGGKSMSGISGDKSQQNIGGWDYWVIKTDGNGIKQWDKSFGTGLWDDLTCLLQTADGGYVAGGWSEGGVSGDKSQPTQGIYDFWIIKLTAAGTKIWDKSFGSTDADYLSRIGQTSDGGYILGGFSYSGAGGDKSQPRRGNSDYWVLKTDGAGNKSWDLTLGGNKDEDLTAVQQTTDGGYILGGNSNSVPGPDKNAPLKASNDYWVIKLAPAPLSRPDFFPEAAITVYPNPNSGTFRVTLDGLRAGETDLLLTDIAGREVMRRRLPAHTGNSFSLELHLPGRKGIYFLQLKNEAGSVTRKILVQ